MSPLPMRRVSQTSVTSSNHEARLELLEYFLAHHDDLGRCAHASLEWLARHAGIKRSACLAVDTESSVLVGLAGLGVSSDDIELFSWPLSDRQLAAALANTGPTVLRPRANGARTPLTPLGIAPCALIPLRGPRERDETALGVLLVRAGAAMTPDVHWLATVLGQKIDQNRGRGSLAQEVRRLRRDRALFF